MSEQCVGLMMIAPGYSFDIGDFICFRPIDHVWGKGETDGTIFRLIKVDMDEKSAHEYYTSPERGDPKLKPVMKKRAVKIDVNQIAPPVKDQVAYIDIPTLDAARIVKPESTNPFIQGPDPFVFGGP